MAISVFPERMDRIDPEDVNSSLRTIESYIQYMVERMEFAMTNTFRTATGLGSSAESIALVLQDTVDSLHALESTVGALTSTVSGKVDKAEGKWLSTNDYTDEDKADVGEIDGLDNRVTAIEAVLTNAGPILYENAQDVYMETGQTSVMSVKALGAVTYKWEHFWNSWTQPNWEGKDTDTLHIPAATSQMNLRQVRCTITGSGWTIYSRVAYIHVT